MAHPLVDQLRFTRAEWLRALDGVSDEDARQRIMPMNCISWMIGHLTWQEHRYWFVRAQGAGILPEIDEVAGYGRPASTPPLDEMWAAWHTVTQASDPYLDALTSDLLQSHPTVDGKQFSDSIGSLLQRVIYHYWFHTGEALAIRQMLGHSNLPEFVGEIHEQAPYRPDPPQ